MLEKTVAKLKAKPFDGFLFILVALLVCIFTILLSFTILQSDDYSYSGYLKDGILNFLRLTKEHFVTVNGRAMVHFFLQLTLALPPVLVALIKSLILFLVGLISFKASTSNSRNTALYLIAFYSFILIFGHNTIKETVMWSSGFFNYIFPALFLFLSLYFYQKGSRWHYLFFFLSGATTEQWGIASLCVLSLFVVLSASLRERKRLPLYYPLLLCLLGYITIFLSPATLSRINISGHTTVTESLFDIPRLSKVFLSEGSAVTVIVIFIFLMLIKAVTAKGVFCALHCLILPLVLILTLPLHHSYMAAFIILCFALFLSGAIFLSQKEHFTGSVIMGSCMSVLIMLPTNTFDYRITAPCVLLLSIAAIMIFLDMRLPEKITYGTVLSLLLASLIALSPSFKGFYNNHVTEKINLSRIEEARDTKVLNYSIDYDKRYAMRQMFNDGWFYNEFLSLYNLEDCTIRIESKNSVKLQSLKTKGLIYNNDIYVPARELLDEIGGSINTEGGITLNCNDKTLACLDGMFTYENAYGNKVYLKADENRIPDFYTLYIKLSLVNEAFNLNIKAL